MQKLSNNQAQKPPRARKPVWGQRKPIEHVKGVSAKPRARSSLVRGI